MPEHESGPFYSYESRRGVLPISWEDYHAICKGLALAVAPFDADIILGNARGGLYPATLLCNLLGVELYPIRLSSRLGDVVVRDTPIWLLRPPDIVAGKRVLIVDEICSEGRTLAIAREEVARLDAAKIRSAVMYAHTGGKHIPNYIGIVTDALIINPWDRETVADGRFVPHPEYVHALKQQGMTAPFVPDIEARAPEKG